MDLGRESTARSSDLLFTEPPRPRRRPRPRPTSPRDRRRAVRNLGLAAVLGLDTAADAVREARQLIFESTALRELQRANIGDEIVGIRGSASPGSVDDTVTGAEITVKVPWNAAFRARTVDINGATYGHIHIRTFYVPDADGFVQEFIRLLEQMPESGLILDVRGNGGGNIWAAERLLQTLTASRDRAGADAVHRHAGHAGPLPEQPGDLPDPPAPVAPVAGRGRRDRFDLLPRLPAHQQGELQRHRPEVLRSRGADRRRQLLFRHRHLRRRIPGSPHRQDPGREHQHRAPVAPTCGSTGC